VRKHKLKQQQQQQQQQWGKRGERQQQWQRSDEAEAEIFLFKANWCWNGLKALRYDSSKGKTYLKIGVRNEYGKIRYPELRFMIASESWQTKQRGANQGKEPYQMNSSGSSVQAHFRFHSQMALTSSLICWT
jgi:hypothetical protein